MPRKSPESVSASLQRPGGRHPEPPADLLAEAADLWNEIVLDRPADFFRPGSLELLAQFCRLSVVQRFNIAALEADPGNADLIAPVVRLGAHLTTLAVKLRISIQTASRHGEKKTDERGPGKAAADGLLGGHAVGSGLN